MITTAIFDLGGVFINIDLGPSIDKLMTKIHSHSEQKIIDYLKNSELVGLYQKGQISSCQFHQNVQKYFGVKFSYSFFKQIWQNIFTPNNPMIRFIENVNKEINLVLLSNTNELHIDYLMKKYSFFCFFQHHIFSHKVGLAKPDSSIYHYTLSHAGIQADQCIFIDDSLPNVETAVELGMSGIHFTDSDSFIKKWNNLIPDRKIK